MVLDASTQVQSWTKVSGQIINVIQAGIVVNRRNASHIKLRSLQAPQLWLDNNRKVLNRASLNRIDRITDLIAQAIAKVTKGSPMGIGASEPLRALIDLALTNSDDHRYSNL